MRYLLGLIVGLAALWLLLSGHYSPLFYAFGTGSCLLTAWICWRMRIVDNETVPLHLLAHAPVYIAWLGWEIAKSNGDVARRILSPGRSISPTMTTRRVGPATDLGRTIYANSVTLTPGTVTVGLRDGLAEVHALTDANAKDIEEGDMDRRVQAFERRGGVRHDHSHDGG